MVKKLTNQFSKLNKIIIYGSWAYDRVMDYPGRFRDAFLINKLHVLSLSFAVPSLHESFGGTAGNIAYNLALLGHKPIVLGSVGNDFDKYEKWLKQNKIKVNQLTYHLRQQTASAYIMTDQDDNQLSAFAIGASSGGCRLAKAEALKQAITIIAPGNTDDMVKLAKKCKEIGAFYIFDPGQQIPQLSSQQLKQCWRGAGGLIGNDYEISLLAKKLRITEKKLLSSVKIAVRTLGPKGSEIWQGGNRVLIPAVRVQAVDPTGAGDAYRAGLLYGLVQGWPFKTVGCLAALVASYAVEKLGTQNHKFTWPQLLHRFKLLFGLNLL